MKDARKDRLYQLLPSIYRMRDAEQGEPLKELLRVVTEQVNLVENDIRQLYENWFIETCEDWVVPYIGDLIGYEPVHEAGEPSTVDTPQGRRRNKILIPRREVANTIRYRRRKGSLALLELLAGDVAGWPARAVEFYTLLGWTQSLNHLHLDRGKTVDVRKGALLDLIDSPFEKIAHTVDVRRINSARSQGRYNIPSVGIFAWRLKAYSVTQTPAYCMESAGAHCFTFSVLGNNTPLYMRAEAETDPTHIADEFNLPVPIRRKLFSEKKEKIYAMAKSMQIWQGVKRSGGRVVLRSIPVEKIIPADLSNWQYQPRRNTVAVDPVLGRIAFPMKSHPKNGVWVNYQYGFSWEIGGGEYPRKIAPSRNPPAKIYRVCKKLQFENPDENLHRCEGGDGEEIFQTIQSALDKWKEQKPGHAVIEILDSGVYSEPLQIDFDLGGNGDKAGSRSLQLRAANRKRPVIRLLDWKTAQPDSMTVIGSGTDRFSLDGILITGRGMHITGGLAELAIRHSTLVPGWIVGEECEPERPAEPSLEIFSPDVCVQIEHSIVGSIQVDTAIMLEDAQDEKDQPVGKDNNSADDDVSAQAQCQGIGREIRLDPIHICISDSIVDATDTGLEAMGAPGCPVAHAVVTIKRSTVIGKVQVHAIDLGENSIFRGLTTVARRQRGCLRFCYVMPGSRTPQRYRCQPDLVVSPIEEAYRNGSLTEPEKDAKLEQEQTRVQPLFNCVRYGTPTYMQLSCHCAEEIQRGADDESEMGVFHDLYQPQRLANLKVRLNEYLPAGMDAGIILSS